MTASNQNDDSSWISIEGPFTAKEIRLLKNHNSIEKLSLTKQRLLSVAIAKGLSSLKSVKWLWLWCTTTRAAMRYVISIPDLEVLDILDMRKPGSLEGFSTAKNLKVFRTNFLTEQDFYEIAKLPNLVELQAHNSEITYQGLESIC